MSRSVTLLGTPYSLPEDTETGWGVAVTNYLVALATAFPQLSGGLSSLTAELDLGTSFGLKLLYLKSETANAAAAGLVRLAKTDALKWRNNANNADVDLSIDASDKLKFNGGYLTGLPMVDSGTTAGQSIATGGTEAIVVFGTETTDSDSAYDAGGTGRFTVPAGKGTDYEIVGQLAYSTAPTGTCTASIYKNGALLKSTQFIAPGAAQSIQVKAVVRLVPTDVIDIRTKHGNGGAQTLATGAGLNFISIKAIPT